MCVLCGIGLTMSLFIGTLGIRGLDASCETWLKVGVLGTLILWKPAGRR